MEQRLNSLAERGTVSNPLQISKCSLITAKAELFLLSTGLYMSRFLKIMIRYTLAHRLA